MRHKIIGVDKGSPAAKSGIKEGWSLESINGTPVYDVIDYEQLTAHSVITVTIAKYPNADDDVCVDAAETIYSKSTPLSRGGQDAERSPVERKTVRIRKGEYEPLGLNFETGLMSPVRQCANHCIFCFIDQMPHGNRKTLYFKDDDWRLSLIMGNYVTLTNVGEREFERILSRRAAPLYITVHATDGEVRKRMLRGKNAENILPRLQKLHEHKLSFNCQIVLCPNINDGEVLEKTMNDLFELRPECRSAAVVPLGMTKHREGLYPLDPMTPALARAAIEQIEAFKARHGIKDFIYASDEMYLAAELDLPPYEYYGDFEQLENGVGLFRMLEADFMMMLDSVPKQDELIEFDSISGVSIAPQMQRLFDNLLPYNIKINVHSVLNDFFGHTITVTGLITARDIIAQLDGKLNGRAILLPHTMLRENDTVFLDGLKIEDVSKHFGMPIFKMSASDGADFIDELCAVIDELNKKTI